MEADIVPYTLHTQAEGEQEPKLEQETRTLKDSTRSPVH